MGGFAGGLHNFEGNLRRDLVSAGAEVLEVGEEYEDAKCQDPGPQGQRASNEGLTRGQPVTSGLGLASGTWSISNHCQIL